MTPRSLERAVREATLVSRAMIAVLGLGIALACAGVIMLIIDVVALEADAFRVTLSPVVLVFLGAIGMIGAAPLRTARSPWPSRVLLAGSVATAALWIVIVLQIGPGRQPGLALLSRVASTMTVVVVPGILIGYLRALNLEGLALRDVARVVIWSHVAFSGCVVAAIWGDFFDLAWVGPGLFSWGMITLFATAAVPALYQRAQRRTHGEGSTIGPGARLTLCCPKCGYEQSSGQGHARCAQCGVAVIIEIEEPRCVCGYLLFRLAGDACPECGRTVEG